MPTKTAAPEEKSLTLTSAWKSAVSLITLVKSITTIKSKEEYEAATVHYKTLIADAKKLKMEYDEHPTILDAKKVQAQYAKMKDDLESSKKYLKDGPMKDFDDEQERLRQAEEDRLAEIQRKAAEKETARLVAEQKKIFDAAEKVRLANEKIAATAKEGILKEKAIQAAKEAQERADAARADAQAIKADAAAAPAAVVVVESTHKEVTRRKVFKWRLTAKDGRKFLKGEMTAADRLKIEELGPLPAHLFVLSPVLLNEYVDSQGEMAMIAGVLEIKSEMV